MGTPGRECVAGWPAEGQRGGNANVMSLQGPFLKMRVATLSPEEVCHHVLVKDVLRSAYRVCHHVLGKDVLVARRRCKNFMLCNKFIKNLYYKK